jgi:hypothetical protein
MWPYLRAAYMEDANSNAPAQLTSYPDVSVIHRGLPTPSALRAALTHKNAADLSVKSFPAGMRDAQTGLVIAGSRFGAPAALAGKSEYVRIHDLLGKEVKAGVFENASTKGILVVERTDWGPR